jgi:hypothetical protein
LVGDKNLSVIKMHGATVKTIFFITVNALHVSGGFSAHHQELENCTHIIGYMSSLLAAAASGSSKQA